MTKLLFFLQVHKSYFPKANFSLPLLPKTMYDRINKKNVYLQCEILYTLMKRFFIILLLFTAFHCLAQNKGSIETRYLHNLSSSKGEKAHTHASWLHNNLAIDTTGAVSTVRVLAKVSDGFVADELKTAGIVCSSKIGNIVTMSLPIDRLVVLDSCKDVLHYEVARRVAPLCNNNRFDTKTDSVHAGYGLPQGYNGDGVLIGITDWGFDYTNISFNNYSEDNHRILRAWDQFKTSGPAPDGFNYGTEFSSREQLMEAQCDTFGLYGYATHGSHVAGIAAGRGTTSGDYQGQAPNANLLLASFLLDESAWIDAVSWMKSVAEYEHKRLVINSSWGMYTFSNLDGTSLLSQAIDAFSDEGVVFVTSGGNNGDVRFHISKTFDPEYRDTLRTVASYYPDGVGQALICWGEPDNDFDLAVGIYANGSLHMSNYYSTSAGDYIIDSMIVVGSDTIGFNLLSEHANFNNNQPHILCNVDKVKNYELRLFITSNQGTVHAWNVCNLENHAGNMGCDFLKNNITGYSNGDYAYGVGEPACASKTIAVAAHHADRRNSATGRLILGNIASFSSHGPLTSGVHKPEISAPGVEVVSSISSFTEESYTPVTQNYYNGRHYIFAKMSGTSMSSPAVTGIVALMLQANPNLSTDEVREILFSSARNDNMTGNIHTTGQMSDIWGWGKADAYHAVAQAVGRLSIGDPSDRLLPIMAFPNPATLSTTIATGTSNPASVRIYDESGRLIWEGSALGETTINTTSWNKGIYIIRVQDHTHVKVGKLVKM